MRTPARHLAALLVLGACHIFWAPTTGVHNNCAHTLFSTLLPAPLAAQGTGGTDALLREGRWSEAVEALEAAHAGNPSPQSARRLAEALLVVGRYEEVAPLFESLPGGASDPTALVLTGRALLARGDLSGAEAAFARAAAGTGPDANLARYLQGEALLLQGERERALEIFDGFIDLYNQATTLNSRELQAVAGAVARLGVTNPALFRDALRAYDEAIAADAGNFEAHLGVGELFLGRYNAPDARQAFREALAVRGHHPDALLGLARVAAFEGQPDAVALADRALDINPGHAPALVFRARLDFAAEDVESAETRLARALEVNPTLSEALAVRGALHMLRGDRAGFEEVASEALRLNPADAGFFETVAELVSRGRLYAEAAEFAGRGIEADPNAWGARATRGLNLMRIGRVEEGRLDLEAAFEGDPFNVRVKNTLDLLDSMDDFGRFESENVVLYLDPADGEALAIYMTEVAERAFRELAARYRYTPPEPVRIEAFRQRADFSVRTVGITGLGALGVAFGPVLAMESPSARGPEGFHWASVLWHEMAHVFHLGMTNHRVPRWFTEGLAVHEERLAGPGWGRLPSRAFLEAWDTDRLRPPSQLSRSFVRPRSPDEVGHAYTLGSMVMAWIEEEHGFDSILRMLEGFRDGVGTAAVVERVLGMDDEAFDAAFERWFRARYATPLRAVRASREGREIMPSPTGGRVDWLRARLEADPADLEARIELAAMAANEENWDEALRELEVARDHFPTDPDPAGAPRLLAAVLNSTGDAEGARRALEAFLETSGGHYAAWLEMATMRGEAGDTAGEAEAIERALEVYPFEIEVHERLATLYAELERPALEVRERRAILALAPVDRAGALYRLGRAQYRTGDLASARRSVLGALELAPRYAEAQELLLAISAGGPGR